MRKIALSVLSAILVSQAASALTREVTVKGLNPALPSVTVSTTGTEITWGMYKSDESDDVLMRQLDKADAEKLQDVVKKARSASQEIISTGRCPNSVVKSGELGRIRSFSDSSISFELICKNNKVKLHYVMADEYAVNIVLNSVEIADLELMANKILGQYK